MWGFRSDITTWVAIAVACFAPRGLQADTQALSPLTGRSLQAKLAQPENASWQGAPLRDTLQNFCHMHQVALLIDRRVDPGQTFDAEARAVPMLTLLEQTAKRRKLALVQLGPVLYLGPPEFVAGLRTLAEMRREDIRRLPSPIAGKFARTRPMAWDDFATPRKLLERLADEARVEIVGLDQIPHDLWAAADLPPLPWIDRVALVAGQFDRTFEIAADGQRVALVHLPAEIAVVRSYPAGQNSLELVVQWQKLAPQCQIEAAGQKIYVKGRIEDIEQLEDTRRFGTPRPNVDKTSTARKTSPPLEDETRFTGKVVNKPLGEIIEYINGQFDLELKLDRQALDDAGVSLDVLISFNVEDATVDELLKAALEPVHCTYRRHGNTIEIGPAK